MALGRQVRSWREVALAYILDAEAFGGRMPSVGSAIGRRLPWIAY